MRLLRPAAVGVFAAAALAWTLPASSVPTKVLRPSDACKPAGSATCDKLLETLTVPAGSTGVTTQTDFSPDKPYRFVFSGVLHEQAPTGSPISSFDIDPFYCFNADPSFGDFCTSPTSSSVAYTVLRVSGAGSAYPYASSFFSTHPPYSASHSYALPVVVGGHVDAPPPLSGRLTFSDPNPSFSDFKSSGNWTIEIYGAGSETVKFAVSLTQHTTIGKPHPGVLQTSAKGVGQLVVPVPEPTDDSVGSTSAKGTLQFSKLRLGGPRVIDIDELTLRLKPGAEFFPSIPDDRGDAVRLPVVVSKSAVKGCKVGSPGVAVLVDESKVKGADAFGLIVNSCNIDERFVNKQKHANVAVVIEEH